MKTFSSIPSPWYDRVGLAASTVCAVHCAFTPVILALAPSLGWAEFSEHWEHPFLIFVSLLAALSVAWGSHCHKRFQAWVPLGAGLTLAWGSTLFLAEGLAHRSFLVVGGLLIAGAHALNQRFTHAHRPCAGCKDSTHP